MVSADLRRASRVVRVLARHGLGFVVHKFGLRWHLPFIDRLFAARARLPDSLPVRIRLAMEELGGAYVKLGQVLSLRPDLVPVEYCEEFRKLLDDAPSVPFSDVKKVIESDLHRSVSSVFKEVDRRPLGSASVAQVYRAVLVSGKEVAVKVMRPAVEDQFHADIDIMYYIARKMQDRLDNNTFSPVLIVEEFEKYTRKELDFLVEARQLEKFQSMFAKYPKVVVPRVHWRESSRRVLVMDFLDGVKLSDIHLLPATVDRSVLARQVLDVCLAQLFEVGVFHGDLHPANILVLPRGRLGLLDFGIVGELDDRVMDLGRQLFVALVSRDARQVARVLLQTGVPSVSTNVEEFQNEIERIVTEWHVRVRQESSPPRTTQMMQHLFSACVRHRIKMPADLVLLGKALVTAEGTALHLDPRLDVAEYAKGRVLLIGRRSLRKTAERALVKGREFTQAVWELPKQTITLMEHLSRDTIRVGIADSDVKHLGFDISLSSNRISLSLLISSLVVAGALMVDVGPKVLPGYSFVSVASFLTAGLLVVPFLTSVWREGRTKYDRHVEMAK